MSELYKNKYKTRSNRLQGYDYSSEGIYFITINTAKHIVEFGEIETGEMQLSEIGKHAFNLWSEIPNKFPYIILGEFIIMPNHMHGILIINQPVETRFIASPNDNNTIINNNDKTNKKQIGGITGKYNPMLHNNISRVIRWYKGRVSFETHKTYSGFAWQINYHDHIIRNHAELIKIENYIRSNPENWENDKFYKPPL